MLTGNPRVIEALDRAEVGFLTAVNEEGQPQTTPVWFLRDGDDLIVYNRPATPRLRSLEANPKVALALRGDRKGSGLLTIEGVARIDHDLAPAHMIPAYLDKYHEAIRGLGWSPEEFGADYTVAVRIAVSRVRAWGLTHVIAAEG